MRCCLGHGCFVLGIKRTRALSKATKSFNYGKRKKAAYAPKEFIAAVGLHNSDGSAINALICIRGETFPSLASANDGTETTPQQIGAYLESVIEGGADTPFRSLNEYRN